MKIYTVWIKRDNHEELPELVVAIDEYTVDNHDAGFVDREADKVLEQWHNLKVIARRSITLMVNGDDIDDAFKDEIIQAQVKN